MVAQLPQQLEAQQVQLAIQVPQTLRQIALGMLQVEAHLLVQLEIQRVILEALGFPLVVAVQP